MSRSKGDGPDAGTGADRGKTRDEFDEAVAELQRTGRANGGGVARRVGCLGPGHRGRGRRHRAGAVIAAGRERAGGP